MAPHSRENGLNQADIDGASDLFTAAESELGGAYILVGEENRAVYVTGHSEYDPNCLKDEYERDLELGLDIHVPENYFPEDDPSRDPLVRWRSHANLLFGNWLNYHVYQRSPFDWISK
jgi:homoserine O-succinyltransferase